MISNSLKSSGSNIQRHEVQDEAARLKAEILQRGDELARLEKFAGSVSSSRQASKGDLRFETHGLSPPTGSRSASTGKIIEQLQREIDHLKLASQAASQSFESEKRAREALRIKYVDLELNLTNLRTQTKAHATTLQRSDLALSAAKDANQEMRTVLDALSRQKNILEENATQKEDTLQKISNELELERSLREKAEYEYRVLCQSHNQTQRELERQIQQLANELGTVKSIIRSDMLQLRTAKEDIILFNERQARSTSEIQKSRQEISNAHREQVRSTELTMTRLKEELQLNLFQVSRREEELEELKQELEVAVDTLRVVKFHT